MEDIEIMVATNCVEHHPFKKVYKRKAIKMKKISEPMYLAPYGLLVKSYQTHMKANADEQAKVVTKDTKDSKDPILDSETKK